MDSIRNKDGGGNFGRVSGVFLFSVVEAGQFTFRISFKIFRSKEYGNGFYTAVLFQAAFQFFQVGPVDHPSEILIDNQYESGRPEFLECYGSFILYLFQDLLHLVHSLFCRYIFLLHVSVKI